MTIIAILMSPEVFAKQMTDSHLAHFREIGGKTSFFHVSTMEDLSLNPQASKIEVLVTGWGTPKITPSLLQKCPSLQLIAHCAGSLRSIINPALFQHQVRITNSADANAIPVAEFLLSWILRWNKKLPYWETSYRQSADNFYARKSDFADTIGNRDQTVGIIGASKVGRRLISLLENFELNVVLYDPYLSVQNAVELGVPKVELHELLKTSDIVSVNAPLLPETVNMIGAEQLALMQNDTLLINTARGKLIDHNALLRELQAGRLHAVLDVTEPEPLPAGSPFFELDNVFLTPHVAGSMGREVHRMTDNVLDEIELFLSEGRLKFEVTEKDWTTAA